MPHRRSVKQIEARCADEALFENVRHIPRHVAFVFQGTQLVCSATNGEGRAADAHAEQTALRLLQARPLPHHRGLRMYVTKVGGLHACSRPCARCSQLLAQFPRLRVYYTDFDGRWVEDARLDSTHQSLAERKRFREWGRQRGGANRR